MRSFNPTADTESISVSASSQALNLERGDQVRVMNNGSATVWIRFGASGVTVTAANGMPIPPGAIEVFSVPMNLVNADVYVAAIAAGATGSIYFTPGDGL
jgi:hypothetical protein